MEDDLREEVGLHPHHLRDLISTFVVNFCALANQV
jgi:hypothetical protein